MSKDKKITNRSFKFGVRIVKMTKELPRNNIGFALGNQLVRSGTSIGANIEEAQGAISKKEFIKYMQISLKEARETNYWIRTLIESQIINKERSQEILKESEELVKILVTIIKNSKVRK